MARKKTYSVKDAVRITGFGRAWISRLCQRGEIGTAMAIPEAGITVYRISEKEIASLKARKNQGLRTIATES